MPSNYYFAQDGLVYSFDDIFVPRDIFDTTPVGGPGNYFTVSGQDIEDYFITEYQLIDDYVGDTLWVWGSGGSGQLGGNNNISRSTPVTTLLGGTNWETVCSGSSTSVAIKSDGTLWLWGSNISGQLGVNNTTSRSTPVTTLLGGTNWKSAFCNFNSVAAIKTDGTLWLWGDNPDGQLGINNTAQRNTPVTTILGGNNWKQVSISGAHTAAIKTDGTLWVWGRNDLGQLGVNESGASSRRSTPVTTILGGTNWKSVSNNSNNTAAIKTDGTLWVWGSNTNGQLGINDTTLRNTPVTTILGGTNWKTISCNGGNRTAAIKTDGTLWTWGNNFAGQLGVNNTTSRSTPVTTLLGGTNWKYVSSGSVITAIKTDGTLWVWGEGNFGALGNNQNGSRFTPVTTLLGGTNWKSVIITGGDTVMALTAGESVDFS